MFAAARPFNDSAEKIYSAGSENVSAANDDRSGPGRLCAALTVEFRGAVHAQRIWLIALCVEPVLFTVSHLRAVMLPIIVAISAISGSLDPTVVIQVPPDCFLQPAFPSLTRPPVQFRFNHSRVDGISAIMPRTILNKANQRARLTKSIKQ